MLLFIMAFQMAIRRFRTFGVFWLLFMNNETNIDAPFSDMDLMTSH